MSNDLTGSIVRILDAAGATAGTGFIVAEDLVATCAHVVEAAGARPGGAVRVVFHATGEERKAQVEPSWWRSPDAEDVAILRLDGPLPEGVAPLPLGSSAGVEGHALTTFGFPDAKPVEGIAGKCEVVGRTTERSFSVLQLRSSEVTPGFSGAPVLDTITRRVVGMVTAITVPDQHGRLLETAFITPTETLRAICPELQPSDLCPYRGLAAFTEADAEFFFGREKLVAKLLDHLRGSPRFLAVVGPSGSGKSSVVQAGLFPALRRGEVPGSEGWHILGFRPGDNPFGVLDAAGLDVQGDDLQAKVQAFLQAHPRVKRLVLFADQFEELFALCSESAQRQLLTQLQALLESSLPVTVLLTLRADFYGYLLRNQSLVNWLEVGQVNVPPMESEELRAVVAKPAQKLGLCFEPGLAEVIAEDARKTDHPLPLLESALTQLWERREDGTLTHAAYQVLGRVAGAIGQWAEDTYSGLDPEDRVLAQRVFTRLVHYGEGETVDTRRRCALSELATQLEEEEAVHQLVRRLADARLLITGEETSADVVEVIHDALLQEWGRLRQWVTEQREFYLWRQRLIDRQQDWNRQGKDSGALLHGALLAEAEKWVKERFDELNADERVYIQNSIELRVRTEQEAERQRERELEQARRLVSEAEARRRAEEERAQEAEARERVQVEISTRLRRLIIGLVALLALILLNVFASILGSNEATAKISQTGDMRMPAALVSSRAQTNLLRMLSDVRGYLALGETEYRKSYLQSATAFEADLAELEGLSANFADEAKRHLAEAKATYQEWSQIPAQLFELRDDQLEREPAYRLLATDGLLLGGTVLIDTAELIDAQGQQTPTERNIALLADMAKFQGTFAAMLSSLRDCVMTRNRTFRGEYEANLATNEFAWRRLQSQKYYLTREQQEILDQIAENRAAFLFLPDQMFELLESEHWREDLYLYKTQAVPLASEMGWLLDDLVVNQQNLLREDLTSGRQDLVSVNLIISIGGGIGLVLGLVMIFASSRTIIALVRRR